MFKLLEQGRLIMATLAAEKKSTKVIIQNVTKKFGNTTAVNEANLDISAGGVGS